MNTLYKTKLYKRFIYPIYNSVNHFFATIQQSSRVLGYAIHGVLRRAYPFGDFSGYNGMTGNVNSRYNRMWDLLIVFTRQDDRSGVFVVMLTPFDFNCTCNIIILFKRCQAKFC
jgi:hypothetical protein